MQLMDNYCPYAAGLLCFLVPMFEPLGIQTPLVKQQEVTLLSFPYTPVIVGAIALTAVLGLLVSLSTFLVIGATSSLTYNVVSLSGPPLAPPVSCLTAQGHRLPVTCLSMPSTVPTAVLHTLNATCIVHFSGCAAFTGLSSCLTCLHMIWVHLYPSRCLALTLNSL